MSSQPTIPLPAKPVQHPATPRSIKASPYSRPTSIPAGTAYSKARDAALQASQALPTTLTYNSPLQKSQPSTLHRGPSLYPTASTRDVLFQGRTPDQQRHDLLNQVNALRLERADLLHKLSVSDGHLASAQKQLSVFHAQCNALAREVGERRLMHVQELCGPPDKFFDEERMDVRVVNVPESKLEGFKTSVAAYIKTNLGLDKQAHSVLFVHRPPSSLPICIKEMATHGYWFAPFGIPPPDKPFELLVECDRERWMYIGRYECFGLNVAYGMTLTEWAGLDEDTKNHQVLRMLSKSRPEGQSSSSPYDSALLALRTKLDTGEYSVPCAGLRCVGYDEAFESAVRVVVVGESARHEDVKRRSWSVVGPGTQWGVVGHMGMYELER